MKKIVLALAAITFSAGAALADNPYISDSSVIQSGPNAGEPVWNQGMSADMSPTASIYPNATGGDTMTDGVAEPAEGNFGDDAPSENVM